MKHTDAASPLNMMPTDLAAAILPQDRQAASLIGRAWLPGNAESPAGPVPVAVRDNTVLDVSSLAPTSAELLMLPNLVRRLRDSTFPAIGSAGDLARNSFAALRDPAQAHLLAPCDLQPVKACGVTYIASVLERLVEERSGGSAAGLDLARMELERVIGGSLSGIRPGSTEAAALKRELVKSGGWSHYLEVAIGPDAESFSKCPPLAAVGFGADIGIRSDSAWNNPEPEIVLAVNADGEIVGVTLGNDVNLRDFEGRSPMLLDKAKDNNASAAIGPFIRLFDAGYTIDDARATLLACTVRGADGYQLTGGGEVTNLTRSFEELVAQTMGRHHQYPDGLMLFTGTMWVPTDNRLGQDQGFGHLQGDLVTVEAERLGLLANRTAFAEDCPPWTFGISALFALLQARRDAARLGNA